MAIQKDATRSHHRESRMVVLRWCWEVECDSSNRIDDPGESVEVDFRIVVDGHAQRDNSAHEILGTGLERGVQTALLSCSGVSDPEIPRDRNETHGTVVAVNDNDRVGS